jgi:hypothetical protein
LYKIEGLQLLPELKCMRVTQCRRAGTSQGVALCAAVSEYESNPLTSTRAEAIDMAMFWLSTFADVSIFLVVCSFLSSSNLVVPNSGVFAVESNEIRI